MLMFNIIFMFIFTLSNIIVQNIKEKYEEINHLKFTSFDIYS